MKVAPYFYSPPPLKKKKREGDGEREKDKNKEHNQKGKGVLKQNSAGGRENQGETGRPFEGTEGKD